MDDDYLTGRVYIFIEAIRDRSVQLSATANRVYHRIYRVLTRNPKAFEARTVHVTRARNHGVNCHRAGPVWKDRAISAAECQLTCMRATRRHTQSPRSEREREREGERGGGVEKGDVSERGSAT